MINSENKFDIVYFTTDKYSVQIFKNKSEQATKVSDVEDEEKIILWANEEINFSKYSFKYIDSRIEKILPFY